MEAYLYCGSSKLIAKHGMGVRVAVEEANCSCAVIVEGRLEVENVAFEGVVYGQQVRE